MFKNKLKNLEKGLIVISYLIFGIGLAISIILIYILYQHTSLVIASDSINNELTGVIGDFFGGVVGTLFALVSVLLFYLAFQHQKRELRSTNEAFSRQQFENTFFNLLKSQNDIRNEILFLNQELKDVYHGNSWLFRFVLYQLVISVGGCQVKRFKPWHFLLFVLCHAMI